MEELTGRLGQVGEVPLFLLASLRILAELREHERFIKHYERGTQLFDIAHNVRWQWEIIVTRLAKRIEKIAEEVERQNARRDELKEHYRKKLEERKKENAALEERYAVRRTDPNSDSHVSQHGQSAGELSQTPTEDYKE